MKSYQPISKGWRLPAKLILFRHLLIAIALGKTHSFCIVLSIEFVKVYSAIPECKTNAEKSDLIDFLSQLHIVDSCKRTTSNLKTKPISQEGIEFVFILVFLIV